MPVFKYRDPQTGEWINVAGGGGGAANIPIQDEPPASGDLWVDTSEEGASGSVDAYTKEETLSEEAKETLGLAVSAVPADAFMALAGNASGGVKIATGSYTGRGTYGKDNPNSLTFDFAPKFLMIFTTLDNLVYVQFSGDDSGYLVFPLFTLRDGAEFRIAQPDSETGQIYTTISDGGRTVSWYSHNSASKQCNKVQASNGMIMTY